MFVYKSWLLACGTLSLVASIPNTLASDPRIPSYRQRPIPLRPLTAETTNPRAARIKELRTKIGESRASKRQSDPSERLQSVTKTFAEPRIATLRTRANEKGETIGKNFVLEPANAISSYAKGLYDTAWKKFTSPSPYNTLISDSEARALSALTFAQHTSVAFIDAVLREDLFATADLEMNSRYAVLAQACNLVESNGRLSLDEAFDRNLIIFNGGCKMLARQYAEAGQFGGNWGMAALADLSKRFSHRVKSTITTTTRTFSQLQTDWDDFDRKFDEAQKNRHWDQIQKLTEEARTIDAQAELFVQTQELIESIGIEAERFESELRNMKSPHRARLFNNGLTLWEDIAELDQLRKDHPEFFNQTQPGQRKTAGTAVNNSIEAMMNAFDELIAVLWVK